MEHTKTIVDPSTRFRVVSDVVRDGFMQFESLLDGKQVPSGLTEPSRVLPTPADGHRVVKRAQAPAYRVA